MKPATNLFTGLSLFLLLLVTGCSERDSVAPTQPEAGQAGTGAVSQAAAPLSGQGTVQIVPAAPTTLDDLRVVERRNGVTTVAPVRRDQREAIKRRLLTVGDLVCMEGLQQELLPDDTADQEVPRQGGRERMQTLVAEKLATH